MIKENCYNEKLKDKYDNFSFTINTSDKSIIYKKGLGSEDLQITKTKCDIKVSKESLDY